MAFIFTPTTGGPHQSPQSSMPPLAVKQINTGTWGANSNTCVITDPYIHTNSELDIWVTGTTPQNGQWAYVYAQGQVTITSSDAESSTLPINYVVQ
jgi:hypothetical protein